MSSTIHLNPQVLCPRCHQSTILTLLYTNDYMLDIKCFCGRYSTLVSLLDLPSLQRTNNDLVSLQKCDKPSHQFKAPTQYCFHCDRWMCPECTAQHQKKNPKHLVQEEKDTYRRTACPFHTSKVKQSSTTYCCTCESYLCGKCAEEHRRNLGEREYNRTNIGHYMLGLNSLDGHLHFAVEQYEKAKKRVKYMEDMVNFVSEKYAKDEEFKNAIARINVLFKNYKDKHEVYFTFIDALLNKIKETDNDVRALLNLYNNAHFHLKRIKLHKADTTKLKLEKISSFLYNHTIPPLDTNTMNSIDNYDFFFLLHEARYNLTYQNLDAFLAQMALKKQANHNDDWKDAFTNESYNAVYRILNLEFINLTSENYTNGYIHYYDNKQACFRRFFFLSNGYIANWYGSTVAMALLEYDNLITQKETNLPEGTYIHRVMQVGNDMVGAITNRGLFVIDLNFWQVRTVVAFELDVCDRVFVKNGYMSIYMQTEEGYAHVLTVTEDGEVSDKERKQFAFGATKPTGVLLGGMTCNF